MKRIARFMMAAAFVAVGATAHANTIQLKLVGGAPTPNAGLYDYTYDVTLTSDSSIDQNGFFVLYDFAGFQSLSGATGLVASNFTFSTQAVGPVPGLTTPVDSPAVLNLVFDANAATNISTVGGPGLIPTGTGNLGQFTVTSDVAYAVLRLGAVGSSDLDAYGVTQVTLSNTFAPTPVPEPGSMVLLGSGLFGLAGIARRRLRRA